MGQLVSIRGEGFEVASWLRGWLGELVDWVAGTLPAPPGEVGAAGARSMAAVAALHAPTLADGVAACGGHYMCECHLTHNFFLRAVDMHVLYNGDDAEFERRYAESLPADGPPMREILADLRAQREKRLHNPVAAAERAAKIAESYRRLHPEVYQLDPHEFLAPGFREVAEAFRGCAGRTQLVDKAVRELKAKGLLTELREGLWSFPVLSTRFCDLLEAELRHFLASGLPRTAPNTMNRYGVILAELGFGPGLMDPLVKSYMDPIASCLLPASTDGLDSYRAFTVLYDAVEDGDRELALHYDNAEVTLNVNIGGEWQGGQVAFHGLVTEPEGSVASTDVVLERGHGVFHSGLELHQALPISAGRRHNLIMWCRSSGVRNQRCPMCFDPPTLVPTNKLAHEGFTVRSMPLQKDVGEDLYN